MNCAEQEGFNDYGRGIRNEALYAGSELYRLGWQQARRSAGAPPKPKPQPATDAPPWEAPQALPPEPQPPKPQPPPRDAQKSTPPQQDASDGQLGLF